MIVVTLECENVENVSSVEVAPLLVQEQDIGIFFSVE